MDAEFTLGLADEWEDVPTAELEAAPPEEPTSGLETSRPELDPARAVATEPGERKIAAVASPAQPSRVAPHPPVASSVRTGPQKAAERAQVAVEEKPQPRDITTGSLLCSRYVLGRLLGAGGNALIFQAEDRRRVGAEDFGSRIAIKVLRPEMRKNPHALTRLRREFRQMQRLSHRGIAKVYELANDEDVWFMTMELIEGHTINQWLKATTHRADGLKVIGACCEALHHAHQAGIVHGDLKPSNVLVLPDARIKLVDFGSAAERDLATGTVESERSFAATPPYASPQVLAGEVADPRDDVFSLACLAYAVLTRGEHPFDRKSSVEAQQAKMRPAYAKDIPPRQFDALVRGLAWDRHQRPAGVREFLHTLLASDLRRDPPLRDAASITVDAPSKPLPTTSAAAQPAAPAPSASHRATATPRATRPAEDDKRLDPADVARLRAAVAAAEAHAEKVKDPIDAEADTPKPNPLDRFKGYVAGPMASNAAEDMPTSVAEPDAERTESAPKRKWTWPWQRSALFGMLVLTAAAIATGSFDLDTEPIRETAARATPVPASVFKPAAAKKPTNEERSASADARVKTEPTTPQVADAKPVALPEGKVSFTTRTLQIGANQTVAALSVKRLDSTRGRAKVVWTIEGGTAQPGVHYQVFKPQVIEFLDGQEVRSLFIPLTPETDVDKARLSRTFTVKLQQATGGPAVGEIKQVYVTIVGDVPIDRLASAPASERG